MSHCNNGLNNHLVNNLIETKVAKETGDLKYLQDSMREFIAALSDLITGKYSDHFLEEYVGNLFTDYQSTLEESLKVPQLKEEVTLALQRLSAQDKTVKQHTTQLSQLFGDVSKLEISNLVVESVADLSTIINPVDGMRALVKSYHTGLGKGGGYFIYDSSKASENNEGTTINGWVRDYENMSITPEMFGAVRDGTTDDWLPLMRAIVYTNNIKTQLQLNAGVYYVSKPLYIMAKDLDKALASINGEGLTNTKTNSIYCNIKGKGPEATKIISDNPNHVLQIGEFADENYGLALNAVWYGKISDLSVDGQDMAKYAIACTWMHYFEFDNIHAKGGTIHAWFMQRADWSTNLWNTFNNVRGTGGEIAFYLHGNSNTVTGRSFFGFSSDVVIEHHGGRNLFIGVSAEQSRKSAKGYMSNGFVRCGGTAQWISPDFETGPEGTRNGFIFATSSLITISQPTIVGIHTAYYDETEEQNGRYFVYPQYLAGRPDNKTHDRIAIVSSNPVAMRVAPKWKIRSNTVNAVVGSSPTWTSTVLASGPLKGDDYGAPLLFHGFKIVNTSPNLVYMQIGHAEGGGVTYGKTLTIEGESTVYLDDKDLDFFFGSLNANIRLIACMCRSSANTPDLEVTTYTIEGG